MITPRRRKCGVADYASYLLPELLRLVDVRHAVDSADFADEMNAVDIAHIQHQYFLFGGVAPWKNRFRLFANRLRVPAVMTVHEFVEPVGNIAARAAIRITNRINFEHRAIKRLVVHTGADRERMAASGIDDSRIIVVRHGVPPSPRLPSREDARRSLGLEGKFVVTLFGFLSRRKGHAVAIEAMRYLPDGVSMLLAGGRHADDYTSYPDDIEQMITMHGLNKRARITGYLEPEQVANVMSATDLIIAPFTESSGSGSLAMAFSCGKPILGSRIAPHVEIEEESTRAIRLFAPNEGEALAQEIRHLRHDPDLLREYIVGAARYAASHSYARMAEETVNIYRSTLERLS